MMAIALTLLLVGAEPEDPNHPSLKLVEQLMPKFGPQRKYDQKWTKNWIYRCSHGHVPYSEAYCGCLIDNARFYWDFRTFKKVAVNVREGAYVPDPWFDGEELCWSRHGKPE